jgi:uncharacterized phosphosugar-binding protein
MDTSYLKAVQQLLTKVEEKNSTEIEQSSSLLADCFGNEGILHVFGCGHSHMIAEEVFYRAGGIVPIRPLFVEDLMLHKGALRSSELEKDPLFAKTFLPSQPFQPNDVLLVVSTSGRNPVPIDVAQYGKKMGLKVMTISSHAYHTLSSRHSTSLHLAAVADIALDNLIPVGDALIPLHNPKSTINVGPGSTIINAAILNQIIVNSVELLIKRGMEIPILKSGNIDGSEEHNNELIQKYGNRIEFL